MSISHWIGIVVVGALLGVAASGAVAWERGSDNDGGLGAPGGPGNPGTPPGGGPPALQITKFGWTNTFANVYTFAGTVIGGDGSAITINFGELDSLVGKTTAVNADGTFSFTIELTPDDYGLATAQAVNASAQQSNVAETYVFP
jgi:hypothetical protein